MNVHRSSSVLGVYECTHLSKEKLLNIWAYVSTINVPTEALKILPGLKALSSGHLGMEDTGCVQQDSNLGGH